MSCGSTGEETARGVIASFVKGYRVKPVGMSDAEWLDSKFAEYPEIWESEEERRSQALGIVEGVAQYRENAEELEKDLTEGKSSARFLEESIRRGCEAGGVAATGHYMAGIDAAIEKANQQMAEVVFVHHPDGSIDFSQVNMCPNLNGNIAEAHHAGSFNIDSAVNESQLHAEVPASHDKNSVDILVKDGANGDAVVGRYQSKYGADATATENQFGARYRGQQKLAPKGQADEIPGATDHIEEGGIRSKPLSKEEAVEMQRKAQTANEVPKKGWNDANTGTIVKAIGKKAMVAGMLAVGFQGARIIGRRMWNAMTGKPNQTVGEDLKEFADSAVKSGASAAGVIAVAGGVAVAAKKGLLGAAMKSAKGNIIGNAVCVAVENAKILWKLGKGEITGEKALDLAGRANTALVGSLALGTKGAALGAAIGTALGPVGTAVGGVIGGVLGGIAGSVVGEAVYEGAKKVCKTVAHVATTMAKGVVSCAKSVCRGVGRVFSAIFG